MRSPEQIKQQAGQEAQADFYAAMVEQHSDLMARATADGALSYVNTAFSAFVQQRPQDLIGQSFIDLLYRQSEGPKIQALWQAALTNAPRASVYEHRLQGADSQVAWIRWRWQPICNDDGDVTEVYLLGQDISELKDSDAALMGSIDQYRQLIEASTDGIYISINSIIYYANPVMAEMIGAEAPTQLVGMSIFDLLYPSYHAELRDRIAADGEDNATVRQQHEQFVRLDGSVFDVEVSLSKIQINKAPATVVTVRDISERRKAEQNFAKFHTQLMQLHQLSVDLAKIESLDDLCREAVEQGRERLGFDRLSIWFISSNHSQMLGSFGTDRLGRTQSEQHVRVDIRPDNVSSWINSRQTLVFKESQILRDEANNPLGEGWLAQVTLLRGDEILGMMFADNLLSQQPPSYRQLEILKLYGVTVSNLIARMRVAQAREDSDARYKAVFESARVGISITNEAGEAISVNPEFTRLLGYDLETLKGLTFIDYTHPEDRDINLNFFEEMQRGERNYYQLIKRFIRKDGGVLDARLTVSPFPHSEDGSPLVMAVIEDMTEQLQSQTRLLESEARHRAMLEAVPDMFFRFNADGIYLDCHTPNPDLLFMPAEEQIGKHYSEVLPPHLCELTDKYFKLALQTGETQSFDVPVELKGRQYYFENRVVAYDANQVLIVVHDMTRRVEATRKLSESEERFQQFASNIDEVIYLIDVIHDRVLYINEAYERLWQLPREGLYESQSAYFSRVHPDDQDVVKQISLRRPEGSEFEYRIVLPDSEVRWMWTRNFPILNDDGEVQRVAGVTKDITERKEMEKSSLKVAVQQERMKLLSDFVRDISHAFRTPLSLISSKLYLLRRTQTSEDQLRHLEGIEEQSDRILKLVESLVTMIRLDSSIEFATALVNTYDLLTALGGSYQEAAQAAGIDLLVEADPRLPAIQGNVEELNTALVQILTNALQHTPAGGRIILRNTLHDDSTVAIVVQDTGVGIPAEDMPRIFDRFFRGSESQNTLGFGLGLSIVQRILDGHNSRVLVESEIGVGSTFTVLLPIHTS